MRHGYAHGLLRASALHKPLPRLNRALLPTTTTPGDRNKHAGNNAREQKNYPRFYALNPSMVKWFLSARQQQPKGVENMKDVQTKYAELDDIISEMDYIDTLAWLISYEGLNSETLDWVARELDEDTDGMDLDQQVEHLGGIMDGMDIDPLAWITNCAGLNDEVLDWVAEQVGYEFDEDED